MVASMIIPFQAIMIPLVSIYGDNVIVPYNIICQHCGEYCHKDCRRNRYDQGILECIQEIHLSKCLFKVIER